MIDTEFYLLTQLFVQTACVCSTSSTGTGVYHGTTRSLRELHGVGIIFGSQGPRKGNIELLIMNDGHPCIYRLSDRPNACRPRT